MTQFTEFFAHTANNNGWSTRMLTGRRGLQRFLRLYQDCRQTPAQLHYSDVNYLMMCGHFLIGVYSSQGKTQAAAAIVFPDRPMPFNARMRDAGIAKTHAFLAFTSIAVSTQDLRYHSLHRALVNAGCIVAAYNERSILQEGWGKQARTWTVTALPRSKQAAQKNTMEPAVCLVG